MSEPATRLDLQEFREAIKADMAAFVANTQTVVVGLMQDMIGHMERFDAHVADEARLRVEVRDSFAETARRLSDHERRIAAIERRLALCPSCPHGPPPADDGGHDEMGVPQ